MNTTIYISGHRYYNLRIYQMFLVKMLFNGRHNKDLQDNFFVGYGNIVNFMRNTQIVGHKIL